MKYRIDQTVRINDSTSSYHKCLAKIVAVGLKSYDVVVGATRMRVVPEQITGVRRP